MPAYNAAPTLGVCLRSIARQTISDWQCLIVDDGSTDDTAAIAAEHAAADRRVRVRRLPHGGLVTALNAGLAECRTPFVARMDADDLMHRERLRLQLAALENDPTLAGVGSHVRLFPRLGLKDGRRAYEAWLNSIDSPERIALDRFIDCPVVHPTLTFRRAVLQEFAYQDRGWPEDSDLILRLHAAGQRIGIVKRRLLAWRDHASRLSRTAPNCSLDRIMACRALFLATDFLAGHEDYVLWGYGETGRDLRRALLPYAKTAACVVEVNPRRIGNTIHGAPVIGIDNLGALLGRKMIVSVAGAEPRRLIRAALGDVGFTEGVDFVCAA